MSLDDLEIEDAQISALSRLLSEALVAELGEEAVGKVYDWPIPVEKIATQNLPALVVCRQSDRIEQGGFELESLETSNVTISYYLPMVGFDRADVRWPILRKVWAHCLSRLRMGRDPAVDDGAAILSESGIDAMYATGTAAYQLAPMNDGWIPCFLGSVQIRVSAIFESPFDVDDLDRMSNEATTGDAEDPDDNPDAFAQRVGDNFID